MQNIKLKIVTPEKLLLETEVSQVTLPVTYGEVTILPLHIPYIGSLASGEVHFVESTGGEVTLALSSGFVEFHDDVLTVLADRAERAEDIDIERAEEARHRAEELMKQVVATVDAEEYARTVAMLDKELNRIRVARKHHSHRGATFQPKS
jgi:F-type H+-transporting ATPase subunit epsilon